MTALRPPRIRHRHCSPASTGSMASPASNRARITRAVLATSSTETGLPDWRGIGDKTMTGRINLDRLHTPRRLSALIGLCAALGACTVYGGEVVTASVPNDYRQRHPIAVQEANRSIVVFVGHARAGLSAPQRADGTRLAGVLVQEGTGAIVADVPVDTPNARAAADTFQEIRTLLAAGGVPTR